MRLLTIRFNYTSDCYKLNFSAPPSAGSGHRFDNASTSSGGRRRWLSLSKST